VTRNRPWMVAAVAVAGALIGFLAGISHLSTGSGPAADGVPIESLEAHASNPSGNSLLEETPPRHRDVFTNQAEIQVAIERADKLLAEENAARAIGILNSLIRSGIDDDSLQLRLAVANEEIGNLESAHAQYQELAGRTGNPVVRDAANVSQARVLMSSNQIESAVSILATFLGQSERSRSASVTAEAAHLFALALLRELPSPSDRTVGLELVHTNWHPPIWRVIRSVESLSEPIAPSKDDAHFVILSEFGRGADGFQLSVHYDQVSILGLIADAGSQSKLSLEVSSKAAQNLEARRVTLARSNISLAALLDLLTLPNGLIWRQTEDRIEILSPTEIVSETLSELRLRTVIRSLRNSLSTWPSHELAPVTWLGIANLQVQASEMDSAISLYDQFLREFPKSPLSSTAWFNKAQIEITLGQRDAARDSLYQLVDGFAGNRLEARAWFNIGRLMVHAEQFDEAVRPLVRASTTTTTRDVQAKAANILASAYLMNGKDSAASMVLMDFRDAVREPPHDRVSAMLGTLARFRVASGVRKEGEGQRLISALAQLRASDYEEDSVRLLAGLAWKALGLHEQMAVVYREVEGASSSSPLRQHMQYEVGEWLRKTGATGEALKVFAQLNGNDDSVWRRRGQESEVRILFLAGKHEECIVRSSELLRTAEADSEKRRLLELLGLAYEVQGDYTRAAQCFSGIVPDLASARRADSEEKVRD